MPASIESLRVGEDTHPVSSDFTPSSSAFTKLSALIPGENKLRYSTAVDLEIDTEGKIEECLESETGCYMLVTGVAEHMVEAMYKVLEEHAIRRVARFTYEQTMESLIVRLVPGAPQENVSGDFYYKIRNKVTNIPGHSEYSLCPVGATTLHFPGGSRKVGDEGFKPLDTRAYEDEWPSLVIEVGYSESLPALRCDAQWWQENSGGRARMVTIIEIAKNPNSLRLECWEMVLDPNRRATRDTRPWRPGFSQCFDIDHAGTVSPAGHDLVIPYRTLFNTSQQGDPDIISVGELSEWALVMYRLFRRPQPQAQ